MVGLLLAAEVALSTIEIRIDRYPFTTVKPGDLFAYFDNPPRKLMARDQWKGTEILIAVNMQIGPTNPHLGNLHDDFIRLTVRIGDLFYGNSVRGRKDDSLHKSLLTDGGFSA
jgi:hypothetical protein